MYSGQRKVFPNDSIEHAGDFTVWKDNEQAWVIFNCGHKNVAVADLREDYLGVTGKYSWHMPNQGPPSGREGLAIMKANGKYFIISSGTTGYHPNAAQYAVAGNIHGPYRIKGNPCSGDKAETTYAAQSRNILQLPWDKGTYILIADRWNPGDLSSSTNVWLPIKVRQDSLSVEWKDSWSY